MNERSVRAAIEKFDYVSRRIEKRGKLYVSTYEQLFEVAAHLGMNRSENRSRPLSTERARAMRGRA